MLKSHQPLEVLDTLNEMEFAELATFNEGGTGVFWSGPTDYSPWEMHPDCDEMLYILEGKIELEVLPQEEGVGETTILNAGSFLIIPRGCWHRQKILSLMKQLYLTPGQSLHSNSQDPRSD